MSQVLSFLFAYVFLAFAFGHFSLKIHDITVWLSCVSHRKSWSIKTVMGSIVASPLPVNKLDVLGPKQRPSWKHWLICVFTICTELGKAIANKVLALLDKAIVAPAFALAKYPTLLVVAESAPLLGQRNMLKETNVARIIQVSFLTHSLAPLSHPLTDNPMQNWPNLVAPSKLPTRCSLMLLE